MRKIAVINHKGGVGKTTTTVNLGSGLHKCGKKVLLIDMDPQAHMTYSLGVQAHDIEINIYKILRGENKIEDAYIKIDDDFIIVPASLDLSGADVELSGIPGREYLLKENLGNLENFDYVLIDCPPSLGLLTLNALVFCDEIFIPLQTEYLALQGMSKLLKAVDVVKARLNGSLKISGIIGTRYDSRKRLNNEIIEKVKEHFGSKLFNTLIRDNISLAEAPSFGQDIFTYEPGSHGATDYMNLSKEVIENE